MQGQSRADMTLRLSLVITSRNPSKYFSYKIAELEFICDADRCYLIIFN